MQATEGNEDEKRKNRDKKEEKQKGSRTKGWWRRGCIKTKENVTHMMCGMHQEQKADKKKIEDLKEAWMRIDHKDECKVKLQSNEAKYWRGTELVMLGGCDFNGAQTAGPAETDLITTERWAQAALGEMMETKEAATYKKKAQARTDQSGERC